MSDVEDLTPQILRQIRDELRGHGELLRDHSELLRGHGALLRSHDEQLREIRGILQTQTQILDRHDSKLRSIDGRLGRVEHAVDGIFRLLGDDVTTTLAELRQRLTRVEDHVGLPRP
jgi:hypothetical protein